MLKVERNGRWICTSRLEVGDIFEAPEKYTAFFETLYAGEKCRVISTYENPHVVDLLRLEDGATFIHVAIDCKKNLLGLEESKYEHIQSGILEAILDSITGIGTLVGKHIIVPIPQDIIRYIKSVCDATTDNDIKATADLSIPGFVHAFPSLVHVDVDVYGIHLRFSGNPNIHDLGNTLTFCENRRREIKDRVSTDYIPNLCLTIEEKRKCIHDRYVLETRITRFDTLICLIHAEIRHAMFGISFKNLNPYVSSRAVECLYDYVTDHLGIKDAEEIAKEVDVLTQYVGKFCTNLAEPYADIAKTAKELQGHSKEGSSADASLKTHKAQGIKEKRK